MKPSLIDSHCHLHFPAYDADREAVLSRMREAGVWAVTVGTALKNSRAAIDLAEREPDVWATVGLHPSHVNPGHVDPDEGDVEESSVDVETLTVMARASKKVVAIGETGLDYYRLDDATGEGKRRQEAVFLAHIRAAQALDLPLVIHCRDALHRLTEMLQDEAAAGRPLRGVVHSFTGTWEEARPLLDLGMSLGINGIATFPLRKQQDPETAIDRTIERMPLERLLVETDAPWLAPGNYRGKRNEPAFVEEVARHIAAVRGVDFDTVASATTENASALFGWEKKKTLS